MTDGRGSGSMMLTLSAVLFTVCAALPAGGAPLELWLTGTISPLAREQLTRLGWEVHDHARESLMAGSAS